MKRWTEVFVQISALGWIWFTIISYGTALHADFDDV